MRALNQGWLLKLNIVCFASERFAGKNLEILYYSYTSIVPGDFVLAAKSFFYFDHFSLDFCLRLWYNAVMMKTKLKTRKAYRA